ncbi:hypothetical protein RUM43_005049 [Polyplax serrata]|uniref:Uncharacterized protein n=1 Tax=Polyplax serrata TaxID=468196 RepID=A0AAN8XMG6_POLSC
MSKNKQMRLKNACSQVASQMRDNHVGKCAPIFQVKGLNEEWGHMGPGPYENEEAGALKRKQTTQNRSRRQGEIEKF